MLTDAGLTFDDIGVWEIHEAFAGKRQAPPNLERHAFGGFVLPMDVTEILLCKGQVLSNLNAMDSESFCKEELGRSSKLGRVPEEKLNLWGGSLSLGHPFGATGARLVTTGNHKPSHFPSHHKACSHALPATNRLHAEDKQFAVVAACADSGIGHACILERA